MSADDRAAVPGGTVGPGGDAADLLALEEIKAVFTRRLYAMDTKQWDAYGPCHTEDVVSESWAAGGGAPEVRGRDGLTAAIRGTLDGRVPVTSVHHGHTPLIEFTGPDPTTGEPTATGIWAMEDRLWWTVDGRERHLHGWGHYHERYRRVGGRWLISYRRLERIRVETD